jgi:hypothetical protein
MRNRIFGIYVLAAFLLVGCADLVGSSSDSVKEETYVYTAYDSTGTAIVEGELDITFKKVEDDDNRFHLEGTWDLRQIRDTKRPIGKQTGEGDLRGNVREDSRAWITLNPNIADDNVTLRGKFEGESLDRLQGEWSYMSWVRVNGGQFELGAK